MPIQATFLDQTTLQISIKLGQAKPSHTNSVPNRTSGSMKVRFPNCWQLGVTLGIEPVIRLWTNW